MKLIPFTDDCHDMLRQNGFKRVLLKRIIEPTDREFASLKEMHIYEAYREGHPVLEKFFSQDIDSDTVKELLVQREADVYIVLNEETA